MERRAKNYLSYTSAALLAYFLGLAILGANEAHTIAERMNPESSPSISVGWFIAIGVCGGLLVLDLAWIYLSKRNTRSAKEVIHSKKDQRIFALCGVGGVILSCAASMGLIGSMPAMPSHSIPQETVAVVDSQQSSESEATVEVVNTSQESIYMPPIPELPPVKPSDNHVELARGVQTISDQQTITTAVESGQPDVSCVLALDGSRVTIDGTTLTKSGDPSVFPDALDFGVNAAVIAAPGSTLNILGTDIETNGLGNTGVVVNGLNASGSITDTDILTAGANSPAYFAGFQGQMKVTGGQAVSNGDGSTIFVPRSTSAIEAESVSAHTLGNLAPLVRASGTFNGQAINGTMDQSVLAQIEPGGVVSLSNSKFTVGALKPDTGDHAVFIFDNQDQTEKQEAGHLTLNNNEWIVSQNSPAYADAFCFVVDQIAAEIELTNNRIYEMNQLARVTGGKLNLNCINQIINGPVIADGDSQVELNLTQGSIYTGAINSDNSCGQVKLSLDESSQMVLTGDVYVSEFSNANSSNSNITTNGFHIYVNGEQKV